MYHFVSFSHLFYRLMTICVKYVTEAIRKKVCYFAMAVTHHTIHFVSFHLSPRYHLVTGDAHDVLPRYVTCSVYAMVSNLLFLPVLLYYPFVFLALP